MQPPGCGATPSEGVQGDEWDAYVTPSRATETNAGSPVGREPYGDGGLHLRQPMRAETRMGQCVGGQTDIQAVTASHLVDETTRWGIRRRYAHG